MIVDLRTYTLRPGAVPRVLQLYEAEGMAIQKGHLGRMVGYFTAETGTLNQIVHMWGYESWEERARRREGMWADPAWIAFDKKVQPDLVTMESKLLRPTRFSPVQ